MIHVVHVRKAPFTLYIGRKFAEFAESKWSNPFRTGMFGRFDCIEKYEKFIRAYLWNDLHELDGHTLGCWCKPKECHGDLLKRLRQEQLDAKIETVSAEHPGVQPTLESGH